MIIGIIGDLHCPASAKNGPAFAEKIFSKHKVDRIVQLGDDTDQAAFSTKYPMNPDMPSPGSELELAVKDLKRWSSRFKEVDVIESNHSLRYFKKALCAGLPSAVLRRYSEIMKWPSGWTYHEHGQLVIDGVHYIHEGFSSGSWMRAHEKIKSSVCMGHLHRAGIVHSHSGYSLRKKKMFSFVAGCMIDNLSPHFDYSKHSTERGVNGVGIISDGENPQFFMMPE